MYTPRIFEKVYVFVIFPTKAVGRIVEKPKRKTGDGRKCIQLHKKPFFLSNFSIFRASGNSRKILSVFKRRININIG